MNTLTNEIRNSKATYSNDQVWAFSRWVEEYAFAHNMTIEDTLNLALFKKEGINYKPAILNN